jgi:glutamine synthetase
VLREAFGKTRDGDYLDYYVEVKRREVQAAHEQVTPWELERYLQLF